MRHFNFILLGRAVWGKTIPFGDEDKDGNGHGTHCAGTVAGKTYGIAKKAKIVAVKVLRSNGSGTMSDVVKGIEYVAKAHKERQASAIAIAKKHKKKAKRVLSAANMSLGGGKSRALDMAVNAVVAAGVHFAVAAGNDDRDACGYSPAAANAAITVGATTVEDTRAWFSNWGRCVDIFGPGKKNETYCFRTSNQERVDRKQDCDQHHLRNKYGFTPYCRNHRFLPFPKGMARSEHQGVQGQDDL
jgi:cerevisin